MSNYFISIARGPHGWPVLGIGTKNAIYTISVPALFRWKFNKFLGYSDGKVQQGYPEFYDALRLQRVNIFPFFFTRGTLLPPPEAYKGFVATRQIMDGHWSVMG